MPIPDTVEVEGESLAQFIITSGKEAGVEAYIPEGVSEDEVMREISISNVENIHVDDNAVEVRGEFEVREVADRIPAGGGGKLEPPINPPEVVTRPVKGYFTARFEFEDLGYAELAIEIE